MVAIYNVYRSDSPMSLDNMPAAIATGLTEKSYSDADVINGQTYYYRIAAVKNGIEMISAEISIDATSDYFNKFYNLLDLTSYNSLMPISADEKSGGLTWGSSSITDSAIIKLEKSPNLKNFTTEFEYTRVSGDSGSSNFSLLFRTTYWGTNDSGNAAYAIYLNPNRIGLSRGTNSSSASETQIANQAYTFNKNVKYLIKVVVVDAQVKVFVNNSLVVTFSDNWFMNEGQFGFRTWTSGNMIAKIENLKIYE